MACFLFFLQAFSRLLGFHLTPALSKGEGVGLGLFFIFPQAFLGFEF
jgi:hypothetical protein